MSVEQAGRSLAEYYAVHRGKVSDKWSSYLDVYQRVFEPYREGPVQLLEIGIQNGGSLEIWAEYFSKATAIVGCDINPACAQLRYSDERIHVVVEDANTDGAEQLIAAFAPSFDIIIDDGSHRSSDIVRSFARYFPRLNSGGVFIAEDLHCSYWGEFEGGLMHPWSSVSFFKRLADVINHEHWGVPHMRSEVLRSFEHRYGLRLDEKILSEIHSVEFLNSVCAVRKRTADANALGLRVVVGAEGIVAADQLISQARSASVPPEQSSNEWSALSPLPEDELLALRVKLVELEAAVGAAQRREEALRQVEESLRLLIREREAESREAVEKLQKELAWCQDELARYQKELARCQEELARCNQSWVDQERELEMERERTQALSAEVAAHAAHIRALLASRSWRVTTPFRWVGMQARRLLRTSS